MLADLLNRFSGLLTESESSATLSVLFAELGSSRTAARKRSIACVASLSASLPDKLLEAQLVGEIASQISAAEIKPDLRRTYIQTLSAVSRAGGYRLGKQVSVARPSA